MELFHEIYSSYINVVQCILTEAHQSPITLGRMEEIAAENAFAESALAILPKLTGDDWPLLTPCGDHTFRSRLAHPTHIPLSTLQKSWLKALLEDRRIRLFSVIRIWRLLRKCLKISNRYTGKRIFIISTGIWMEIPLRIRRTAGILESF